MKKLFIAILTCLAFNTIAQDGTIYPLEVPKEPNAIPLNTGSVKDQPAPETWFRQWGDPMARNISQATLTPFFPEKGKANGAAVIVAPTSGTTKDRQHGKEYESNGSNGSIEPVD